MPLIGLRRLIRHVPRHLLSDQVKGREARIDENEHTLISAVAIQLG